MKTNWLTSARRALNALLEDWGRHRCSSHGAAVAFYTLFSLGPVIVLVLEIAAWFVDEGMAAGALAKQVRDLTGLHAADLIEQILSVTRSSGSGLWPTVIATGALVIGATTAFAELKAGLDEIWDIDPSTGERHPSGVLPFIRSRLLSLSVVLVLVCLLLLSLMVTAVLVAIHRYWSASHGEAAWPLAIASICSFLIVTVLFAVILKVLPEARIRWRDAWVGAFVTATLVTLGKHLIGIYLGHVELTSYFGAAGSLGVLLLWVYIAVQIFFLGAEITKLHSTGYSVPPAPARAGMAKRPQAGLAASSRKRLE